MKFDLFDRFKLIPKIQGIYSIRNKVLDTRYIGQTTDMKKRFQQHRGQLKSGKHTNKLLQQHFFKYGYKNFEFEVLEDHSRKKVDIHDLLLMRESNMLVNLINISTIQGLGYVNVYNGDYMINYLEKA